MLGAERTMVKVFTDFNARTPDGVCFILKYRGANLEGQLVELGLGKGDKIVLYQDDDFEVTATLDMRYVDLLKRESWVAVPDWSTVIYKTP